MKTAKQPIIDSSSSRRAQPLRQTRNNPPRSSISRPFGSRASIGDNQDVPSVDQPVEIFPAITHFADAITALPKELVRHFTLLKEVDAKIFTPEEELGNLVDAALNAPLPERTQPLEPQHDAEAKSVPMSTQNSMNGSTANGNTASATSVMEGYPAQNRTAAVYDPANLRRRQLFQHCALTMQNMLISLDEKNHVISTAGEALSKHLARVEDCFANIENEISEEARYGSTTHWAYPENRVAKVNNPSRKDVASVNHLSAAAQQLVDEAAQRSDMRKQALAAKRSRNQHVDSDFDDHAEKQKEKKLHGNSKVRKAADASTVGLAIANGAGTNGNPQKRRKVEKGAAGALPMERSLSGVFGNNGTATKGKANNSPRETPQPDGAKKKARGNAAANGQTRKRNGTVNSLAMSPSIASSPIRSTFPEPKLPARGSPGPTNGRPVPSRARQNSIHSVLEPASKRPASAASNKPALNGISTPDLSTTGTIVGRTVPEVKATMKESGSNSKGEHLLEDANQQEPEMIGGIVVGGSRRGSTMKHEETETNGDAMQDIQTTTITTTKSGRASKPATPAMSSFPEPVRSRSGRNALEAASSNKRSHKKGAGAAAQQLMAQQTAEMDDADSSLHGDDDDGEIDANEPTYCYCNGVSYGEMVACDGDGCEKEWFHLDCAGLKVAPKGNAKWFCNDCTARQKSRRFNGR
ncbi:chromatin modification-related protein [Coleophoma crateriformis]|uniref:Chromatin modification-related protein n=1 Tax=Coleophoma crateriformis TaxID=565419 RepID=A0A3D8R2Y1_9HELO|nr:chromatin modification-related protein [Coleophoma crateriformis]